MGAVGPITAAIWVAGEPSRWLPTVQSLRNAGVERLVIGGPSDAPIELPVPELQSVSANDPAAFLRGLLRATDSDLALVARPVLVPEDAFGPAQELLARDLRLATVSFSANAAGLLSTPWLFHESDWPFAGHDQRSATALLRERNGTANPIPVLAADGPVIVVSSSVSPALIDDVALGPGRSLWGIAVDLSLQARRRGFLNVCDPTTYLVVPGDLAEKTDEIARQDDAAWVRLRHPFVDRVLAEELADRESAMSLGLEGIRRTVEGMRVLIDGSKLGPAEMGTQVALVRLIAAISERPEVATVAVTSGRGRVPDYASAVLSHPKVVLVPNDLDVVAADFDRFDVGHRPFQPEPSFDVAAWRRCCDRVVVSVLDVIAYQVGAYLGDGDAWSEYRRAVRDAVAAVDAVVVISDDVRRNLELERLPTEASRVFVVPLGTEHLTGDEPRRPPPPFERPTLAAEPFILCLGTNYAHKNRDLAVHVREALAERGHDVLLVLVGASVPSGSSRVAEARALAGAHADRVLMLPDVTAEERNWLLAHARLLLYPTSAEGFGFVPFEAARFGTPSVSVSFGPLRELGAVGSAPAENWSIESLAESATRLLADPAVARREIEEVLRAGTALTWARCASGMLSVYRWLLDRPPRTPQEEV
jgi:glycosyltransferase involved in cell wall biosynthesis